MSSDHWDIRHEFESRNSVPLFAGLVIGLTAFTHPIHLIFIAILLWLRPLRARCYGVFGFIIGLLIAPVPALLLTEPTRIHEVGHVISAPKRTSKGHEFPMECRSGTYLVSLAGPSAPAYGATIHVDGTARPFSRKEDPDAQINYRGVIFVHPADCRLIAAANPIFELGEAWRTELQGFFGRSLPAEAADLVSGVCFGSDEIAPTELKRLRTAGILSLISVSGLQVILLGSLLFFGLSRLPVSRLVQLILLCALLSAYGVTCGLHHGVVRAIIFSTVMGSAYLFRREADGISAFCLAGIVELLWHPDWVYQIGFQMSFCLIGSLLLYLPRVKQGRGSRPGSKQSIGMAVGTSGLVWVSTVPLLAYAAGQVNLAAPLATALVLPTTPFIWIFGNFSWALSLVSPSLGQMALLAFVSPFAGWDLAVADVSERLTLFTFQVPPFSAYWLVALYVLVALGARYSSRALRGQNS